MAGAEEIEITSKTYAAGQKRFFFNLKQNSRGRFLKIAEVSRGQRNTVIIPENGWAGFARTLQGFIDGSALDGVDAPPAPAGGDEGRVEDSSGLQVWVENLPWETDDASLRAYFEQCGEVSECVIQRNGGGRSRGTAIIRFATPEGAGKAMEQLNETEVGGRSIRVRLDRYG
jgi:hypothetical protein